MVESARSRLRVAVAHGGAAVAALERRPLLHRAILRAIPVVIPLRFDRHAAGGLEATFELRVRNPAGGDPARFAIAIDDGRWEARPGGLGDGATAVTVGAGDLVRFASAAIGWPELLAGGRLELSGNPLEALRFPTLFRLAPAAAGVDRKQAG